MKDTTQNGDAGKRPPDYAIIPRHIWRDRSLTNADRAVYDTIAAHAGGEDKRLCWPSTDTIADESGVRSGTVSKCLAWLIHRGHVERDRAPQKMPDGKWVEVTTYVLAWTNESSATPEDRAAFFQERHPSRRERAFPSVEVSPGGNSTGGNPHTSPGGNGSISTQETSEFPGVETQKNRPSEQTRFDQTKNNNTHTHATAASLQRRVVSFEWDWTITSGMDLPKCLSQIANGNRLWGDIRPKRWAQFVGEHAGQQFSTETLRTTFQAWCKQHKVWEEADARGMRKDPTSENSRREALIAEEYKRREGMPFCGVSTEDASSAGDNRIKISLDLALPDQVLRMKAYRDAKDGAQRARADWREFLSERFKQDPRWAAAYPHTYLGRFRDWLWQRSCRREPVAQHQPQPEPKVPMDWNWLKSPNSEEVKAYGRKQLYEDDATMALDKFVRKYWKQTATAIEWRIKAANWIDNERRWMSQQGMEVP